MLSILRPISPTDSISDDEDFVQGQPQRRLARFSARASMGKIFAEFQQVRNENSAEFRRMGKKITEEVSEIDDRLDSLRYGLKNTKDRLCSLRVANHELRSDNSALRDRGARNDLEIQKLRSLLVEVPLNITQGICNTCGVLLDEKTEGTMKHIMDRCGAVCINFRRLSSKANTIDSRSAQDVHKSLM
jgi:DNA repair exonuclease SbcCD ATPase subunit